MHILIIYAHPATKGHCSTILDEVKSNLKSKKIKFEVLDLYKIKYDPVMHEGEHYTAGNKNVSKQNKLIQKKISESDIIIFIYPVWWSTMPAVLKGFFDKVLTSNFAYKYINGSVVGLLKGKGAIVFMTSGGSRVVYTLFGNPPKRIVKLAILRFCGIRSRVHQFFNCRKLNNKRKSEIKRRVTKALSGLK